MEKLFFWGLGAMLVVKALDVLHQESLARASGNTGYATLPAVIFFMAIGSAIGLVYLAHHPIQLKKVMDNFDGPASDYVQEVTSEVEVAPVKQRTYRDSEEDARRADAAASEAASRGDLEARDRYSAQSEAAKAAADAAKRM